MTATNTFWVGNQKKVAQVVTGTLTGTPASTNTAVITINNKSITYTFVTADTTTTMIAGLLALLKASTIPEFNEITWTASANVLTATAKIAGTPFYSSSWSGGLSLSSSGLTFTLAQTQANVSCSDAADAANWNRGGSYAIPTNGDPVIFQNCTVPVLWNLQALSAVQAASVQRYQTQTGQIGLPYLNALGYIEYRPTYFQITASGTLPVTLGLGSGSGPPLEKYNFGSTSVTLVVLASGTGGAETPGVKFLSSGTNTAKIVGTAVGMANLPSETSSLSSASVENGGSLALGVGVVVGGTITVSQGSLSQFCTSTIVASNNSTVTLYGQALTYAAITATLNTRVTMYGGGTITAGTLATNSILDKSQNNQALTITNFTMDGTCQVIDSYSVITWSNPITVTGNVNSGPLQFLGSRTVQIA
jgi:hypothetical protein